jgi:hypothetical protein
MPATAAQVFGPIALDPGFTTTGEKTLLTMNTTLPSGGRNIILVSFAGAPNTSASGVFRIYKGSTLLYETRITGEYFSYTRTRPHHHLLIAVDSSPSGNDSYSFRINVTTSSSTTGNIHVQGMVIKADTAVWGYNTTAVSIAAGATGTVTSINTSFASGSKVVVIATVYASAATTTTGDYLVGAGNIKLKAGTTVVSSNQFNIGSYGNVYPLRASLIYLDTPSSGSQTYSVEITNGSTQTYNCWAEIVAFDVYDAAFLDTGSVAVGTSQTTVGNLSTTLSGDVAVIALAAAERTATTDGTTFNANTVVLQKDGSSTDEVSSQVLWYMYRTSYAGRSGVLPLFRYDTGVSNPSYQVKMTANSGSPNGEAKMLAFSLGLVQYVNVSDVISFSESVSTTVSTFVTDTVTLSDIVSPEAEVSASDTVTFTEEVTIPQQVYATDSANIVDSIGPIELSVSDSASFTEAVGVEVPVHEVPVSDSVSFTETVGTEAQVSASDAISFSEAASAAASTFVSDTLSLSDTARSDAEIPVSEAITFTEEVTVPQEVHATDSVSFTESVGPNELTVLDAVSFTEAVGIEAHIGVSDAISFTETASRTEPIQAVSDTITFSEVVSVQRNIQRLEAARRLITAKRVISDQRESGMKRSSL